MAVTIQVRRDTSANWVSVNPVLNQGEPGLETDTGKLKIGDGSTAWNSLAYGPAGLVPKAAVTEVTYYVSAASSASDSNDGLSTGSAKATIAGALTALGSSAGLIQLGYGTFTISAADGSGNGATLTEKGTVLRGLGIANTVVVLGGGSPVAFGYGIVAKAALCSVSDFSLQVGSGSTVTYGVGVTTSTSAENCTFSNIRAQPGSGTLANAFAVSPDANQDVAFTNFWNCTGTGCTGAGWLLNDGTSSNVLDTRMFGCTSNGNASGIQSRATNFAWYGGDFGENTTADINIASIASGPITVQGARSEASARLLLSTTVGVAGVVSLKDIYWGQPTSSDAAADGAWISHGLGGSLILDNVQYLASGTVQPLILLGNSSAPLTVSARGLATAAPLNQLFSATPSQNVSITVENYVQIATSSAAVVATVPGPVVMAGTGSTFTWNGTARDVALGTEVQTLSSAGAVTIAGACQSAEITLHANATSSSVTNLYQGQRLTITWLQNSTGGWTYAWPSNVIWAAGIVPANITAANGQETAQFVSDGTNLIQAGTTAGQLPPSDALSSLQPSDIGVVAWTVNPALTVATVKPSSAFAGDLLTWLFKSPGGTASNINYGIDASGAGLDECFLGIYSLAGTLLCSCTTDQSTSMMAAAGAHAAALTSVVTTTLTTNTLYRIGLVIGAQSTMPTFAAGGAALSGTFTNLGVTSASLDPAAYIAGTYTALPSSFTPSSLTPTNIGYPVFVIN